MEVEGARLARALHFLITSAAAALIGLALPAFTPVEAKAPGVSHCYRGVCHRVRSVEETRRLIGQTALVETSHYDHPSVDRFNTGKFTSNGERFDARDPARVASANLPDGTELLLRNPDTGLVSHVRVNDFGPFRGNRLLDVTRRVADDLGFARRGVTMLEVTVVAAPQTDDLKYQKDRPRLPTRGHIGNVEQDKVARLVSTLIAERAGLDHTQVAGTPARAAAVEALSREMPQALEAVGPSTTLAYDNPTLVPTHATVATPPAAAPVQQAYEPSRNVYAEVRAASAGAEPNQIFLHLHNPAAANTKAPNTTFDRLDAIETFPAAEPKFQEISAATFVPALAGVSISAEPSVRSSAAMPAAPALAFAWAASPDSHVALLLLTVLLTSLLVASALTPKTAPTRSSTARTVQQDIVGAGVFERALAPTTRDSSPAPIVENAAVAATTTAPAANPGSLLEPDIEIEGTVRCKGRLTIAGRVTGRVEAGHLVILAFGSVDGEIVADTIEIAGAFRGRMIAETVTVKAGGRVCGDIETTCIAINETAEVDASIRRTRR